MPTWSTDTRFLREFWKQSDQDRARVRAAIAELVVDLRAGQGIRPGLRVKRVQGADGVFELTWAADGRATFEYGTPIKDGEKHVIWRRCGGHEIFADP